MSFKADPAVDRILNFLYQQVKENKIPQIKKGMVEDLEAFVASELAVHQAEAMAKRMRAQSEQALAGISLDDALAIQVQVNGETNE